MKVIVCVISPQPAPKVFTSTCQAVGTRTDSFIVPVISYSLKVPPRRPKTKPLGRGVPGSMVRPEAPSNDKIIEFDPVKEEEKQ